MENLFYEDLLEYNMTINQRKPLTELDVKKKEDLIIFSEIMAAKHNIVDLQENLDKAAQYLYELVLQKKESCFQYKT